MVLLVFLYFCGKINGVYELVDSFTFAPLHRHFSKPLT